MRDKTNRTNWSIIVFLLCSFGLASTSTVMAQKTVDASVAGANRYTELANLPFKNDYPTPKTAKTLEDEIFFQRGVMVYLWAQPAMNMYSMKEGTEKLFGKGYNIMSVYKDRLNAKTIIPTPNSDVIYGIGFLDLTVGPMVIDAPPNLQALIDDMWHRVIPGPTINGHAYYADIGLPGPDKGKGGKYLILPPGYDGDVPKKGYFVYRSRTNGVFVFLRSFFKDPKNLKPATKTLTNIRIYPYGKEKSAKKMQYPNASNKPNNMVAPSNGSYFNMLDRFIQAEVEDSSDAYMRGILATLGIEKGKKFSPNTHEKMLLDNAAKTAWKISKSIAFSKWDTLPKVKWYENRHWVSHVRDGGKTFGKALDDFNYDTVGTKHVDVDARIHMFSNAYSMSPGMISSTPGVGAKYLEGAKDSQGNFLTGDHDYTLTLPANIPAKNFWSITAYDPETASGLDNGQPFPSLGSRDKPVKNADGSTTLYFSATAPKGKEKNWIKIVKGKGWFTLLRLYGPEERFFNKQWIPGDFERVK